jgi:O-antigen/teichoic acid export membrane protein
LGLGLVFFAVAWLAAPAVESFYGTPSGMVPFRVLATVLVVHSLRVVPLRLLEKTFDFRAKLVPTVAGSIAYLVVSVAVAMRGLGVWSFVLGIVVSAAVETLFFWLRSPWRPRWRVEADIAREALAFGWPVVLGAVLIYLFTTIDRVSLARWGGPGLLGPYAFAFSLAALPTTINAAVVGTVLLPSYSALAGDHERRLALHLRAAKMTAAAGVLFSLLAVVFGGSALRAAYGTKWLAAVHVLGILSVGSVFRSMGSLVGDLLVGVGRPKSYQTMNALQLGVAVVGVPLGLLKGGAAGVAVAVSAASAVALFYGWAVARAPLGTSFAPFLRVWVTPLRAGLAGGAVAAIIRLMARGSSSPGYVVAQVAGVAAVFCGACWVLDAELRADVRGLFTAGSS